MTQPDQPRSLLLNDDVDNFRSTTRHLRVVADGPLGGEHMGSDREYFAARAKAEREAALNASHPAAKQAHLELADRYDDLANAIGSHEQRVGLDSLQLA